MSDDRQQVASEPRKMYNAGVMGSSHNDPNVQHQAVDIAFKIVRAHDEVLCNTGSTELAYRAAVTAWVEANRVQLDTVQLPAEAV